jgi:hypothetical protein
MCLPMSPMGRSKRAKPSAYCEQLHEWVPSDSAACTVREQRPSLTTARSWRCASTNAKHCQLDAAKPLSGVSIRHGIHTRHFHKSNAGSNTLSSPCQRLRYSRPLRLLRSSVLRPYVLASLHRRPASTEADGHSLIRRYMVRSDRTAGMRSDSKAPHYAYRFKNPCVRFRLSTFGRYVWCEVSTIHEPIIASRRTWKLTSTQS